MAKFIRTFLFVVTELLIVFPPSSLPTDTITQFESLRDGNTLVSEDESFEMGFFSPSNNSNRYLGIWYKGIPVKTVVWVANRENPVKDNSSKLSINSEGRLIILSHNKTLVWSANSTTQRQVVRPILQLLNSGNLVLREEKDKDFKNYLWQSFDYPSDTFLPGMKIGWNLKSGLNRQLSAWKNWDDPSPGDLTWGLVLGSTPELVMWKNTTEYYRSGPWNGERFSGKTTALFQLEFVSTSDEVFYTYNLSSVITRVILNESVYSRQRYNWIPENQTWRLYSSVPRDNCDNYNLCGAYGNCLVNESPPCECLTGFKPKLFRNWEALDWTQGCVQSEEWRCQAKNKDGFQKFSGLKMPDTTKSWVSRNLTLDDCRVKCWENCSCTAYANLDIRGEGSGCQIWFGDLMDLRVASVSGQDLYIRMPVSPTGSPNKTTANEESLKGGQRKKLVVAIPVSFLLVIMIVLTFSYCYWRKRKLKGNISQEEGDKVHEDKFELPFFDFTTIVRATNNFSSDKRLGQGGFGPVYMGILINGQEVAVKRLAHKSGQGAREFKNEVILCAKLQHRNLVKVLGCCIHGEERILIYEYMSNKSLDSFLFDSSQRELFDWPKRFNIIFGIARGLLYLHQDSRLRIIHRDLKTSNILLDNELNPKISDFGIARMFTGNQIEANTKMVAGTYGYMAPEYAIEGIFSIKSDVFSFGIILLEVVSGRKNTGVFYPNHGFNLLGHAWRLWKEKTPMKLVDACLGDAFTISEVLRCIHIGLLCVQLHPEDRPNMTSVLLMLNSENTLPQPKEPGFIIERMSINEGNTSSENKIDSSTNEITATSLEAR
ncbi:G-type lectin S-receptor-like serine/threonine-protein kinase At4g27290 isoform X2 [Arachis stenosperma]|uniref:G-type lectin S-receptor-like serine/threonine-protein kinase At4g27290 isoform X2 n=1 Tax=Arachis stenosperma TaxID=217475 RepID=UPI0025AD6CCD|nr:G-type lectin S-receptor-like serine/threonine-protein kinase At4g27290 isoform X2 [Arachis stenosperma]